MSIIYDKVHEIAKLVEESEHYLKVKELSIVVKGNEEYMKMIAEYNTQQQEMQQKRNLGQELTEDDYKVINETYLKLMTNEEIKSLFEAEEQLGKLINDIFGIINEPLKNLYQPEGQAEASPEEEN